MIHPSNLHLAKFQSIVVLCLVWVALFLPVDVCFDVSGTGTSFEDRPKTPDDVNAFEVMERIIDVLFWVDLCLNFCVGYWIDHKHIEFGRSKVASRYVRSWFLVDLVACLSSLTDSLAAAAKLARLPRLLRLMRLMRLLRLLKFWKLRDKSVFGANSTGIVQVAKIFCVLIVVAHWSGSVWYLLAAFSWSTNLVQRSKDCHDMGVSWIQSKEMCDDPDNAKIYMASVYWAFSTLSTVGYGDISATNKWELAFSLVMMNFGVAFYSAIAGTVVNLISNFNKDMKEQNKRRNELTAFCFRNHIPDDLRLRLVDHLEFSFQSDEVQGNEEKILSKLSPNLQTETMFFLHRKLIESMTFFRDKSDPFIVMVVADLKPRIAYPDDTIVTAGDKSEEMFFVNKGEVCVVHLSAGRSNIIATLGAGDFFGTF